jgi:hypothetical protein
MAAMLLSTAGKQDQALEQLKHFDLTHRIHPNVWQPPPNTTCDKDLDVVAYQAVDGKTGVLPDKIYQQITQLFAPQAAYWKESDYDHRGYYSYFTNMPTKRDAKDQFAVTHVIDDVIWNHMYPLVLQQQKQQSANKIDDKEQVICGAEWWVHTRPVQANLGHNLHFDTDEALLDQEGIITHPLYSTVLYLTGGNAGSGATIVLDQTPDSKQVATKAWRCVPKDNSILAFPGQLLHGVLPCPGESSSQDKGPTPCSADLVHKQWIPSSDHGKNGKEKQEERSHRLTFMVGFWTRRVPDKMKTRKLYGPCGPLPPRPSDEKKAEPEKNDEEEDDENENKVHSWVDEIHEGYDEFQPQAVTATTANALPVISPAWECIGSLDDDDKDGEQKMLLEIPKAIDHRFFVRDAPKCFRDSLFEREEEQEEQEEEGDDEEDYEVHMVEVQCDNE